jgi:hypothetical protein
MYIILQIGCDCFIARPVAKRMRKHAAAFTCHAGRTRGSPASAAGGARRRHAAGTQREIETLSADDAFTRTSSLLELYRRVERCDAAELERKE